jgi:hypothetical protein
VFKTRRGFLGVMLGAALPLSRRAPQDPMMQTIPPKIGDPKIDESSAPMRQPERKAVLESNSKDIKKDVQKLYQLAGDLKSEVDKTDSVNILSLTLLKKVEEIEKLAKEIKSRAKG